MPEETQTDIPQQEPETPATEETRSETPEASAGTELTVGPPAPDPAESATPTPEGSQEAEPGSPAPAGQTRGDRPPREPRGDRPPREQRGDRPPKDRERQGQPPQGQDRNKGGNERRGGQPERTAERQREAPRGDRRADPRRPESPVEIEYDKLVADSLYLDNQAHVLVARLRDLDAGTRSQLRRLYGAVRRACRAVEGDRQHQFVMLRARLAYTIARHGLRSLDPLEKLLLQVTRRNETRGYDRFRDLFEAIIAYNE